ncbi:MAG: transposase, partial [Spirochaetota bacterium]|nr:transposase [Spirochaetota bacterium]
ARNTLKLNKIRGVFFDCWYSSTAILKRIRGYGWHFYTQVKSNRTFNKVKVKFYRCRVSWNEV